MLQKGTPKYRGRKTNKYIVELRGCSIERGMCTSREMQDFEFLKSLLSVC
jgi:hypothetical protein